jgi:hypothetical protein
MHARFPQEVASALARAGWFPGRRLRPRTEQWIGALHGHVSPDGHRHSVFPAAVEAWAEFGELTVDLDGAGRFLARTPFTINPMAGLHRPRTLADLGRALGLGLAPLGEEHISQALLAIDAMGRVHSLDSSGDWFLGETVDQALTTLIAGTAPARLALHA